jgi:hypothetical protein
VRELADESKFMHKWRRDGPLGVLLSVINHVMTPQQYALFAEFQRLAHRELPTNAPAEDCKILEPVKPGMIQPELYEAKGGVTMVAYQAR